MCGHVDTNASKSLSVRSTDHWILMCTWQRLTSAMHGRTSSKVSRRSDSLSINGILGRCMARILMLARELDEHTFGTVVMYDLKVSLEGHLEKLAVRSSTTGSRIQESIPMIDCSESDPNSKYANDEKTGVSPVEERIQSGTSGTNVKDRRFNVDMPEIWEIVSASKMTPRQSSV